VLFIAAILRRTLVGTTDTGLAPWPKPRAAAANEEGLPASTTCSAGSPQITPRQVSQRWAAAARCCCPKQRRKRPPARRGWCGEHAVERLSLRLISADGRQSDHLPPAWPSTALAVGPSSSGPRPWGRPVAGSDPGWPQRPGRSAASWAALATSLQQTSLEAQLAGPLIASHGLDGPRRCSPAPPMQRAHPPQRRDPPDRRGACATCPPWSGPGNRKDVLARRLPAGLCRSGRGRTCWRGHGGRSARAGKPPRPYSLTSPPEENP